MLQVGNCSYVVGCVESGGNDRQDRWSSPPQRGNTVYVHGHGISEEIIQRAFAKIGGIANVSMDTNRKSVLQLITSVRLLAVFVFSGWMSLSEPNQFSLFAVANRI